MGHHSCCNKQKVRRGLWSPEEDEKLIDYISTYGHGCWSSVPRLAGLERCGKSCRLRWINYLRPDLKRGKFSRQEAQLVIKLQRILGNRWSQIAKHLPGRTDNDVKNFWNSRVKKKLFSLIFSDLATLPDDHISINHQYSGFNETGLSITSANPSLAINAHQDYFRLHNPISELQPTNNHGDVKPAAGFMDYNTLLQDGSSCETTWSFSYQPHENQKHGDHLLCYHPQDDSNFISKPIDDPLIMMSQMPNLCEMLELDMDEDTGLPSSSSSCVTREGDPSAASLPVSLFSLHTNQTECILAAIMPSSSSSSLPSEFHGVMNPNIPQTK